MSALARTGLLRSRRGAGGGHALARDPSDITVGDVTRAVQGCVLDVPRVTGSAASEAWSEAARALESTLNGMTIEALARRQRDIQGDTAGSYMI